MIATNGKWNKHKFGMKKFQSLDVGALILWRAFGLTEYLHTFCYENWQILMNESAFRFWGRWILATTVFHFPKSTSTGGIPDFFRVCSCTKQVLGLTSHMCKRWFLMQPVDRRSIHRSGSCELHADHHLC
jgi:hypothetical protein